MVIYEEKVKHLPFPKNGPQKYDVITPKDLEKYGNEYLVIDYYQCIPELSTKPPYNAYELHLMNGYHETMVNENKISEYTKLYSVKNKILLNITRDFDYYKKELEKAIINDKYNELKIDYSYIKQAIELIETFNTVINSTIQANM